MVERMSIKAQELDLWLSEAILGVKTGKFKSLYTAAKALTFIIRMKVDFHAIYMNYSWFYTQDTFSGTSRKTGMGVCCRVCPYGRNSYWASYYLQQNILQSWIPKEVISKWHFSANTKGWRSNLHGLEWLKCVFEPSIREKATQNGQLQQRLLICDGHDSHISGSFISYCIQNRISLLILPPHTSHMQFLDLSKNILQLLSRTLMRHNYYA